jgi:hypothetical protein
MATESFQRKLPLVIGCFSLGNEADFHFSAGGGLKID